MSGLNVKREPVILDGRFATIRLTRGLFAIVNIHRFDEVNRYRWRATRSSHCFYATRKVHRNGQEKIIYLHRVIMHTPSNMECHHRNFYTMDCREENLENLTPLDHAAKHHRSR